MAKTNVFFKNKNQEIHHPPNISLLTDGKNNSLLDTSFIAAVEQIVI